MALASPLVCKMQKGIQTHEIISLNKNHNIKVLNVLLELTANISYLLKNLCLLLLHRHGMVDHHYNNCDVDGLQFWSISKLC